MSTTWKTSLLTNRFKTHLFFPRYDNYNDNNVLFTSFSLSVELTLFGLSNAMYNFPTFSNIQYKKIM